MNKEEKMEVTYKKLKSLSKKEKKQIESAYSIETRFAIIMVIDTFGSSNIKKIATLLKKNEATIYYHIKEMVQDPELLLIDEEVTRLKKGKFYKLSPMAVRYFTSDEATEHSEEMIEKFDQLLAEPEEVVKQILIDMLKLHPNVGNEHKKTRQELAYNHIIETIMVNNLENAENAFKAGKEPKNKNYPFGSISNVDMKAKISSVKHLFRFLRLFTKFYAEFTKLKKEIEEEMKKGKVSEEDQINLRYSIVGGEISEFDFE